jgi:hypothetical protein
MMTGEEIAVVTGRDLGGITEEQLGAIVKIYDSIVNEALGNGGWN